jgi:hypothetical protein
VESCGGPEQRVDFGAVNGTLDTHSPFPRRSEYLPDSSSPSVSRASRCASRLRLALLFDPRPLADLEATLVAKHEFSPAFNQHHASFGKH